MLIGRPRTNCPTDDELEVLGKELLTWVIENKPLHVSQWYSMEKFISDTAWDMMIEKPIFRPYYERALKIVGLQYLDKTSNVRDSISQRWLRVYFKDLRKEEDETARFNSSLKADESNRVDAQTNENFAAFSDQLAKAQELLKSGFKKAIST